MRTRHGLRGFLTCIVPLLAAMALAAPARAQQPPFGQCASDAPADSAGVLPGPHRGMLATFLVFLVAPSALLLMGDEWTCAEPEPWPGRVGSHVAVYGAGGVAFTGDWRGGTAQWGGVELLVRGVYAEARVDRYSLSDGVRMWDARAGYFLRPQNGIAGGVTVGYREVRDAPDEWVQSGVLIGFPIVFTACDEALPCWLHWEPTFVISDHGLAASPRARLDVRVPRTPFVARLEFESRGVRRRDPMALSIGLGLRP